MWKCQGAWVNELTISHGQKNVFPFRHRKFQTPKNPSIIPVTWNPEYPTPPPPLPPTSLGTHSKLWSQWCWDVEMFDGKRPKGGAALTYLGRGRIHAMQKKFPYASLPFFPCSWNRFLYQSFCWSQRGLKWIKYPRMMPSFLPVTLGVGGGGGNDGSGNPPLFPPNRMNRMKEQKQDRKPALFLDLSPPRSSKS